MDVNNVRQRLEQVVAQSGFRLVTDKSDKLSHYYELNHKGTLVMSVIRVSNHCTDVSTWKERYGSINPSKQLFNKEKRRCRGNYAGLNDKYFQKKFYSIVIFDPTTDGVQNSGDVNDGSIFVKQIVYDATKMTNENLVECENFIKTIASGNITENINRNRNMNKNRVRLTESQLHKVIKESVKQVLSELDWKTYANAAKKAEKRRDSRKDSFLKKATQEINKKYPYRHSHSEHFPHGKNDIPDYQEDVWFNPYLQTKYGYMNANSSSDSCATAPRWWDNSEYHKSFGDRGTKAWSKGEDVTGYHKGMEEPTNIGTSDDKWDIHTYPNGSRDNWDDDSSDLRWDWNAMSDDMENYYSGKSKYKKGKGWQ